MCGIAGVACAHPQAIEPAVGSMMRAMMHRGPDDEGYAQVRLSGAGGGVECGLGFRRLAILDLSPSGHQPMVNPATGDVLIFNGEIYNYRSLRSRLQSAGHEFRSSGDTEVLLRALSHWGDTALRELDGMFALAFFHAASRRLLLARDPLGIKPLYVARVHDAIVFASEVTAVLASGLVPDELCPAGIAGFLAYGAPQDPLTVHRFVESMPAGSYEWLAGDSLASGTSRCQRYWRFPAIDPSPDEGAAIGRIRSELEDSVRQQCASDVPLGVFLSGGIDSATMAALAVTDQGPPKTFAVGYEVEGAGDETAHAAETAYALGTNHFQTIVDNDWVMLQWYEWLKSADRPSIDGLNTYIVSGAVKDRDITVALSGLGADELFGGYPSFRRIPKLQRAIRTVAWLPRSARRAAATAALSWLPAGKRFKLIDMISSGASAVELTALTRRVSSDRTLARFGLDTSRLGLGPGFLPAEAWSAFNHDGRDTFQAVSQAELVLYMGNTLLRDSDTNSMAHSLEIRVPFLGQKLVDYISSLSGARRAPPDSTPKHLLRRAMADTLPPGVFSRPKTGFSLPFTDWIFGPLRDQCEAAIAELAACSLFEASTVNGMWLEYERNRSQIHWSRPMSMVVLGSYLARRKRLARIGIASRN